MQETSSRKEKDKTRNNSNKLSQCNWFIDRTNNERRGRREWNLGNVVGVEASRLEWDPRSRDGSQRGRREAKAQRLETKGTALDGGPLHCRRAYGARAIVAGTV